MDKLDNEELVGESWDKKKIVIAVVVVFLMLGVAYAAKTYILKGSEIKSSQKVSTKPAESVAGTSTQTNEEASNERGNEDKSSPFSFTPSKIREDAQQKLYAIKQQVANLKVEDVASSSPQIQKVINDLKSLEQYPKDQAKQMCENICKSL